MAESTLAAPQLFLPSNLFLFDLDGSSSAQGRMGERVTVNGPTLLRVDMLVDTTGAIFSTVPVCVRLYAAPDTGGLTWEPATSPINRPYPRNELYIKGAGPYLYLPAAGTWRVWMRADRSLLGLVLGARCSLLQGTSPEVATVFLAGQHGGTEIVTGSIVLAALGESIIPDPATVGAAASGLNSGMARYWGLQSLSITAIAGTININLGGAASAANGQPLAVGNTNLKVWPELAGASVHVQSVAGGTVAWRARYY